MLVAGSAGRKLGLSLPRRFLIVTSQPLQNYRTNTYADPFADAQDQDTVENPQKTQQTSKFLPTT
jgi:hypothetical protein